MKKRIMCLVLAASLAATMAGCGKQNAGSTAENKSDDKSAHKIALITDTIGTEQFILQAYHEMEKLSEEYGFEWSSINVQMRHSGQKIQKQLHMKVMI